jgi:hypothetical protein
VDRLKKYNIGDEFVTFSASDFVSHMRREDVKGCYDPRKLEVVVLNIQNLFADIAPARVATLEDIYRYENNRYEFYDMCARAACDIWREDILKEYWRLRQIHEKLPAWRRNFITEFEEGETDYMEYDEPAHLQLLFISIRTMQDDIAESYINESFEEQKRIALNAIRLAYVAAYARAFKRARAHRSASRQTFSRSAGSGSDSGDPDQSDPDLPCPGPGAQFSTLSLTFPNCQEKLNSSSPPWHRPSSWPMAEGRRAA